MIEHNVPLPGWKKDRGEVTKMQVGDSIVVDRKVHRAIRTAMFRLGWRVSVRRLEDEKYRLWRTR